MKHNSKREKQIILLIIPNGEGWHDIAVKKLLALLRGMESKHNDVFYCLSCLHSIGQKTNMNLIKEYLKTDFCNVVMPKINIRVYSILKI